MKNRKIRIISVIMMNRKIRINMSDYAEQKDTH